MEIKKLSKLESEMASILESIAQKYQSACNDVRAHFIIQNPLGPKNFEVDFAILGLNLVIEVDEGGCVNPSPRIKTYLKARDAVLHSMRWYVFRFTKEDIEDPEHVKKIITNFIEYQSSKIGM